MTRKRVKQSLERTLSTTCGDPVTEGTGMIKSPITICKRDLRRNAQDAPALSRSGDVMLRVHP